MARAAGSAARLSVGALCVALLAAGYATAETIAPPIPYSVQVRPRLPLANASLPLTPPLGVSVPSAPTITLPAPPEISLPPLPTVSVPELSTPSTPVVPSTPVPVPPGATPTQDASARPASGSAAPPASASPPRSSQAVAGRPLHAVAKPRLRLSAPSRSAAQQTARRRGQARRTPALRVAPGAAAVAPASSPRAADANNVAVAKPQASSNPLEGIGRHIPLPIPVPDWSKPIILALLLLATWFAVRSRIAALRARRLERQRVTLIRDLGAMQAALVPELPARIGGLAVSVAYRPAEGPAAGGDFYDVFATESGKVAFMLGDVAGHGPEKLTHAALTRYTLRAYLQAGLGPRAAVALAGQVLRDTTGDRCATVAVGVYDPLSGVLTYSLAGHPPPILLGFPAPEPVTFCSSPPIGWGMPTGRRQTTVSLPVGGEACFFSDGLIEARSNGQLLGRERLREILAALGSKPEAAEVLAQVRAAADRVPDDMVACVLAPQTGATAAPVHVEELEVDPSALERAGVRRFLAACLLPAPDIERTIELASAIAASHDTALLRVELEPRGPRATVLVPEPEDHIAMVTRTAHAMQTPGAWPA
jgi:hypothetical protein